MIQPGKRPARTRLASPAELLSGYYVWLEVWGALLFTRRRGVLIDSDAQRLLLSGEPSLFPVPLRLFGAWASGPFPVFPACAEPLDTLRALERLGGAPYDWDALLAACRKRNARVRLALSLLTPLPPLIETDSALSALAALCRACPAGAVRVGFPAGTQKKNKND